MHTFHIHLNFIISFATELPNFKQENHLSLAHVSTFSLLLFRVFNIEHWNTCEALTNIWMFVLISEDNDGIDLNYGLDIGISLIK